MVGWCISHPWICIGAYLAVIVAAEVHMIRGARRLHDRADRQEEIAAWLEEFTVAWPGEADEFARSVRATIDALPEFVRPA